MLLSGFGNSALGDAINTPSKTLVEMGKRGRNLIQQKYTWSIAGDAMVQLYGEFYLVSPVNRDLGSK